MIPWNPIKRIDMFHDTNVFNPYLQESFSVHPSWSHSITDIMKEKQDKSHLIIQRSTISKVTPMKYIIPDDLS